MPKFKPKTNKNIEVNENDILTVDRKHEEILKELKDEENKIPKLEEKIEDFKIKLEIIARHYEQQQEHDQHQYQDQDQDQGHDEEGLDVSLGIEISPDMVHTSNILEYKLNILDEISKLQNEIMKIKQKRKEYYLNNSRYLFNYFESKKDISKEFPAGKDMNCENNHDKNNGECNSETDNNKGNKDNKDNKRNSNSTSSVSSSFNRKDMVNCERGSKNSIVKSFFKIKDKNSSPANFSSSSQSLSQSPSQSPSQTTLQSMSVYPGMSKMKPHHRGNMNAEKTEHWGGHYRLDYHEKKEHIKERSRSNLPSIDEMNPKYYFSNMDESFIDMQDYVEKYDICEYCEGEMSCIESEGIMVCKRCFRQKEYLVEHDKPSYKEPPKEVSFYAYKRINHFREIIAQFQAKETTNIDDQVIIDIKQQIKKERITMDQLSNDKMKQILKKLGYNKYYEHISFIKEKIGIKPPKMSIELETKLCNLFLEIQKPYAKFCPNARVNFLNYYYVLYKLCELLREDSYLPYFYMLKDQVKRMEQDEIWKKICKYLNWEFIPTL